jgi:hypothetical protein
MHYMFLIYTDPAVYETWTEADTKAQFDGYMHLSADLAGSGRMKAGDPLQPASTATKVSVRDGRNVVSDGPFAETKEQLIGYYVVECTDLDDAIAVAARIPDAANGVIEIRPIMVLPATVPG